MIDLVLSPLHSCYPFSAHHPLLVTLFLSLLLPTTSSTLSPLPTTPLTPFPLYPLPVPATCPLSAPSTPNPPCPCQPWPRPSPRAQRGYGAGGRGPGSVRSGPSPPPSGSPSRFSLFFYSNTQNGEWTCNSWSSQPISGHNPADRRHPKPIGFRSLVGSASQRRATLATTNRAHPAALGGGAKVQDRSVTCNFWSPVFWFPGFHPWFLTHSGTIAHPPLSLTTTSWLPTAPVNGQWGAPG